jgi:hypothetical protein
MRNTSFFYSRISLLMMGFLFWASVPAIAQSTDVWGEEDDEEEVDSVETGEESAPVKHDDALVKVNDQVIKVGSEFRAKKDEVLNISVRQLQGGSPVIVEMKKGGINLSRKVFYSNSQGELDLEVKTGNKKVSGEGVLTYTPKGQAKKTLDVKIYVE